MQLRAQLCLGILGLDFCVIKSFRIGGHCFHRLEKTTFDIPPLVPSHYRAALFLVFLFGIHSSSKMVHCGQLLHPFLHVYILWTEGITLQNTKTSIRCHHQSSATTNDCRCCGKCPRLPIQTERGGVWCQRSQYQSVFGNVCFLLLAIRSILLQGLFSQKTRRHPKRKGRIMLRKRVKPEDKLLYILSYSMSYNIVSKLLFH